MTQQEINCVYNKFHNLNDEEWLDVLKQSINKQTIDEVNMPSFPPVEMQQLIHSHSDESALQAAFKFFQEIKNYAQYCGKTVTASRTLLDFGCGWGRVARLFMKDLPAENIFGAEPTEDRLMMAKALNPYTTFIKSPPHPPTVFADNCFDYVVALSVFSHLNEFLAKKWVIEFTRILKPGGLMFVTTQSKRFLDVCHEKREMKANGTKFENPWHELLANSFVDAEKEMQRYRKGEFLFSPTSGLPPKPWSWYGDTIIPPEYVRNHWTEPLVFVEFMDDPQRLGQALIVMQKP